ncbi:MAG: site-2 protease family protein [Deltaproteobacteria bacterium]|nr:site-2 protease family protein [Deltaproteobacteria bacterium]
MLQWSFSIGRLFGIPIRVHWTMLALVLVFVIFARDAQMALQMVALTGLVLVSVVLHELGHALVARRFGLETKQILLMPLNGAAILDGRPKRWTHDFWIAFAGPLTSLAFAGLGMGLGLVMGRGDEPGQSNVLWDFGLFNLYIGAFNLVPAFPLDGGRMLRAVLERALDARRATRIAAMVGRVLAVVAFAWGAWTGNVIIAFAAMFVFTAASAEEKALLIHGALAERRIHETMVGVTSTLSAGGDMSDALRMLGENPRLTALPVTFGERVIGVVHRTPLLYAAAQGLKAGVSELLDRNVVTFEGDGPLQALLQQMGEANSRAAVIVENHEVRGVITVDRLIESLRAAM